MKPFRLSWRALLRGAGGVAIALPWLEIMGVPRRASAQPMAAQRFISVYTPGGTVLTKWRARPAPKQRRCTGRSWRRSNP